MAELFHRNPVWLTLGLHAVKAARSTGRCLNNCSERRVVQHNLMALARKTSKVLLEREEGKGKVYLNSSPHGTGTQSA